MKKILKEYREYLKARKLNDISIKAYSREVNELLHFVDNSCDVQKKSIFEIDKKFLLVFFRKFSLKKLSNRSIAHKMVVIKDFFEYLKKNANITCNPAEELKIPKFNKKISSFFTQEQMTNLMEIPTQDNKFGIRNRAILELMYSCGLRVSEIVCFEQEQIDFRGKFIKIFGRGAYNRFIPIGSSAIKSIKDYLKIRDQFASKEKQKNLFLSKSGRALDTDQIRQILARYIALVSKNSSYSPSTIRHSFATHLLNRGADPKSVSVMLGHSNLANLEGQKSFTPEEIKKIYKKTHPRGK